MLGPNTTAPPGRIETVDGDGDGDVDLADAAMFTRLLPAH